MKALIVLAIGLLLLGGAAFGGWTLYNEYIVKAEEEQPPKPPPKPPSAFVRVNPVVVPLIGDKRVEQFVTVVVTLEVNADQQPAAQANLPRIGDAFLTTLYGAVDDRSVLRGNVIDIPAVKAKLLEAAGKVLGADIVQNILVQVVVQRNL
jgi:flagellar basal body-associated protein FliL